MFKYLLFLLIGIILFILLNNKDNFSVSAEPGDEGEECTEEENIEDKCNNELVCINETCINPCKDVEHNIECSNDLCNYAEDPILYDLIESSGVCIGKKCMSYNNISRDERHLREEVPESDYILYTDSFTRQVRRIPKSRENLNLCANTEDAIAAYSLRYNDASSSRSPIFYGAEGIGGTTTIYGEDILEYMPGSEPYLGPEGATSFTIWNVNPVNSLELCNKDAPRCSTGSDCQMVDGVETCIEAGKITQPCRSDPYNKCDDDLTCHTDDSGKQRCVHTGDEGDYCNQEENWRRKCNIPELDCQTDINDVERCIRAGNYNQVCRTDGREQRCIDTTGVLPNLNCEVGDDGVERCIRRGYINELCRPAASVVFDIPRCRSDDLKCLPVNGVERCILAGQENQQCRTDEPRCVRLIANAFIGRPDLVRPSGHLSCEVDEDGIEKCLRRGGYHQRCMSGVPNCRDHLQCRLIQGDPYPTCRTRQLFGGVFGCAARPQEQP
jgi:hypothetical protein